MRRCPECGTQDHADGARFCGNCGALLPSRADGADAPPTSAGTDAGRRGRTWWALGLVGALLAAAAVAVPALLERPTPALWERTTGVELPLEEEVVAAGPDHVLVGGRVVPTDPDAAPTSLRQLPPRLAESALDGDRWALVEGGALVTGSLRDGVSTRRRPRTGGAVGGTARAWLDGDPVLLGEDGHLVRLRPGGQVVWWSQRAVTSLRATGERWLLGEGADGGAVAIAADDGAITPLAGVPLAVVGDVAVLRRDAVVVGVALPSGTVRWERADAGGVWRSLAGALVLEGADTVLRLDPEQGTVTGEVPGAPAVATAAVVVTRRGDELLALDWTGSEVWRQSLLGGARHRLVAVDAARVAVRSRTADATTVVVVGARDGTVLATTSPLPTSLYPPGAEDGVVGIVLPGRAGPLVLDATTGATSEEPTPPIRRDRMATEAGPLVLNTGLLSMRAAGPQGAWRAEFDHPVAASPIPLVASLYVTTTDGTLQRLDAARGTVRWQQRLDALPTALAAAGPDVYVGTADGRVVVLDDLGAVIGSIRVGSPVMALGAADDVVVVVAADGAVRGYAR